MKLYKIKTSAVYATGDLHGEYKSIPFNIKRLDLYDCAIIVCGDIGLGFGSIQGIKNEFAHITKTLSQRNVHLYLLRGNHDNADLFNNSKEFSKLKYIHVIPDYSVLQIVDENDIISHNILCVGGATSIDRTSRLALDDRNAQKYKLYHGCSLNEAISLAPKSYWPNEQPVYDEEKLNEIKDNSIVIDTICTHTCPTFCKPLTKDGIKYWMNIDKTLEEDIDHERDVMDLIHKKVISDKHPLKNWIYGHYHFHNYDNIEGVNYRLLDMCRNGLMDIVEIR